MGPGVASSTSGFLKRAEIRLARSAHNARACLHPASGGGISIRAASARGTRRRRKRDKGVLRFGSVSRAIHHAETSMTLLHNRAQNVTGRPGKWSRSRLRSFGNNRRIIVLLGRAHHLPQPFGVQMPLMHALPLGQSQSTVHVTGGSAGT